jgi:hypothetical protein
MVLYHAGAYVNKLKLFEREFTYEAMQIHVDSVIIYRSARIRHDREEAQRQRLKYRCPKIRERIRCARGGFAAGMSSQHADHAV